MSLEKPCLLVSACLLGVNCRYDGKNGYREEILQLKKHFQLVPVCPEQLGGLETPRKPSEIRAGAVVTSEGKDVTDNFKRGARECLKLAQLFQCEYGVLKERSPSCGYGTIYDGTFTGTKISGNGVAAGLLTEHGVTVFGESRIQELLTKIQTTEEL